MPVVTLVGLPETQAANLLIDRLNGRLPVESESAMSAISTLSYPGGDRPQVWNIPTRNRNFTGRDKDLRQLRDELRNRRMAVFSCSSSTASEGSARPRSRWSTRIGSGPITTSSGRINCAQAQYVDASLGNLGQQWHVKFRASVPEQWVA